MRRVCVFVSLLFFSLPTFAQQLDRATALRLSKAVPVTGFFPAIPAGGGKSSGYTTLVNKEVLVCANAYADCSFGKGYKQYSHEVSRKGVDIGFMAGILTPAEVTGIVQKSKAEAVADVRLELKIRSSFFVDFQEALFLLDVGDAVRPPLKERIRPKTVKALFQRYDDGWRFVRYQ